MKREYIYKIGNLRIHRGTHVFLPEDLIIRANYVMLKRGYRTLKPYIISLIRRDVEKYFDDHPDEVENVIPYEVAFKKKYGSGSKGSKQ